MPNFISCFNDTLQEVFFSVFGMNMHIIGSKGPPLRINFGFFFSLCVYDFSKLENLLPQSLKVPFQIHSHKLSRYSQIEIKKENKIKSQLGFSRVPGKATKNVIPGEMIK